MTPERRAGSELWARVVFLAIPLIGALAINVRVDMAKPLWLDELIVSKIALLPHVSDMWKILVSGQSPHPPLNFLAVRAVYGMFGVSELTTRLPSTLGFVAMEICLFLFVSKRSNAAFGTVAMMFPLVTMARIYTVEAKPYGALLGWTGIALMCWRHAGGGRWRPAWLMGLGLSIGCAVSSHFFGALLGFPILAGEVARFWERRFVDWKVCGAVLLGYVPLLWFLPILRAGNEVHGLHPWQAALGVGFIFSSADQLLAGVAAPLLICLVAAAASRAGALAQKAGPKIPVDEIAAAVALALLPVVALCGARMAGVKVMEVKYVIPAVVGFAILTAWSAYALAGRKMAVGIVLSMVLGVWGCRDLVRDLREAHAQRIAVTQFSPPEQARALGPLPIVLETQLYMLLSRYARPEIADRLYFLIDLEAVQKYFHSDALHRSMLLNPSFFGPHVEKLSDFQRAHREFLIYEAFPNDVSWMLEKYKDDGARIELLKGGSSERWYLVRTGSAESR